LKTGPKWSFHGRLISPLFTDKYLKQYAVEIQNQSTVLIKKWKKAAKEKTAVNVHQDLVSLTFDIIGQIAFSKKMNAQAELKESEMFRAGQVLMSEAARRTSQPKVFWGCPPSRKRLFDLALDVATKAVNDALHVEKKESKQEEELTNMCLQMQAARDSGEGFSTQDVFEEAMTLMAAGHETTSNTLSWSLLLLSQNPSVLETLRAELNEKVKGASATYEEAKDLNYSRAVIYETLRIYPTVPAFPRVAEVDTKLLGYDVPKGAYVFISQMGLNLNPQIWAEPLKFRPERFIKAEDPKPSKPVGMPGGSEYAFVPFGAGARTCIGQRLGLLEAIIILSSIVKSFNVSLNKPFVEEEEVADITLGPKQGLWMDLTAI